MNRRFKYEPSPTERRIAASLLALAADREHELLDESLDEIDADPEVEPRRVIAALLAESQQVWNAQGITPSRFYRTKAAIAAYGEGEDDDDC